MMSLANALMAVGFVRKADDVKVQRPVPAAVTPAILEPITLLVNDGRATVILYPDSHRRFNKDWRIESESLTEDGNPNTERTCLGFRSEHPDAHLGGNADVLAYCRCSTRLILGKVTFTSGMIFGTMEDITEMSKHVQWIAYCRGDI